MSIYVDSLAYLPNDISLMLKSLNTDFMNSDFIDELIRGSQRLETIQQAITDFLEEKGVVAYHYTRANKKSIEKNGLIVQEGVQRRQWFLEEYGHLFTLDEVTIIQDLWDTYFTKPQNSPRDWRIWFNHTKKALSNGGAAPLLEMFGGEMVNKPLSKHPLISPKLKQIGEPLIVHCCLKPSMIKSSWENPSALVWLSTYHRHLHPKACFYDVDIYSKISVPAENIMMVEYARAWK